MGRLILKSQHRVCCSDSTDPQTLAWLIGSEQIAIMLTDPPYSEKTHDGARSHKDIDAPSITFSPADVQSIRTVIERVNPATWTIVFVDYHHVYQLEQQPPAGHRFVRFGVWVKPNSCPQFTGDRPATGWEAIGILHRDGGRMRWNGGGGRAVWTVNKQNEEHPTAKPVELVAELLRLFSDARDAIADPFLGAGSTLIAVEQLSRKLFGCELDPAWVDVALTRYQALTGEPVIRESDGAEFGELQAARTPA